MTFNLQKYSKTAALFFLGLYLPLALLVYSPVANIFTPNAIIPEDVSSFSPQELHNNLKNYLLYQEPLLDDWSKTEKLHYQELRTFYVILFVLAWVMLTLVFSLRSTDKDAEYLSLFVTMGLIALLPFFGLLWSSLHPIFFTNEYWIISVTDISYYLFPLGFFKAGFIFMVLSSIALHGYLIKR